MKLKSVSVMDFVFIRSINPDYISFFTQMQSFNIRSWQTKQSIINSCYNYVCLLGYIARQTVNMQIRLRSCYQRNSACEGIQAIIREWYVTYYQSIGLKARLHIYTQIEASTLTDWNQFTIQNRWMKLTYDREVVSEILGKKNRLRLWRSFEKVYL